MIIRLILLTIIFLLTNIGCGGGKVVEGDINGRVVKGILSKAQISVYTLSESGEKEKLITSGTTDDFGYYSLKVPGKPASPLLVIASVDEESSMRCDTGGGCLDAGGQKINFGDAVSLSDTFTLSAILPSFTANETYTVNVNLFTHLASKLAFHWASEQDKPVNTLNTTIANFKVTTLLQNLGIFSNLDQLLEKNLFDIASASEILLAIEQDDKTGMLLSLAHAALAQLMSTQVADDTANLLKLSKPGNYSEAIDNFAAEYIANNGELKLYNKSSDFSVQAILEAMQEEIRFLESRYEDLSFANLVSMLQAELDELNIQPDTKLEPEIETPDPTPEQPDPTPDPQPDPDPSPQPSNPLPEQNDQATTSTGLYASIEKILLDELEAGKRLITSLRTMGHTLEENANLLTRKFIGSMGDELIVEEVTDDFLEYTDLARTFYPKVAGLVVAMVRMGEAESDLSYDLALDEDDYLPEGVTVTGIVTATTRWGMRYVSLENGFIDGLGDVELHVRAWKSYCYYYCYGNERVSIELKADGKYGSISLQNWGADLERSWSWSHQAYLPRYLDMSGANLSMTLHKEGAGETLSINNAYMDLRLRWPYGSMVLPTMDYLSVRGSFYNYSYDQALRWFDGRLSYTNNDWYSYATDPVQWAKSHSEYFTLSASFNASVRVPDPDRPYYPSYQSANITTSMSNSRWSGVEKSLTINYDDEYFYFRHRDRDSHISISNRVGALVEALIDPDAKTLILGNVSVGGKPIASIENSDIGPIIRYSDGTLESL